MTRNPARFRLLLLCLLAVVWPQTALPCRYTVRETGFVDMGVERYLLRWHPGSDTPKQAIVTVERIAQEAFRDSPVILEIVTAGVPGLELVAPDGRSLSIPVSGSGKAFETALQDACRRIAGSAFRETLVQHLTRQYGVVLLLEGASADANARAREAAGAAIDKINREMKFMPKPVAHGPSLLVLKADSFSEESILLWSLGPDERTLAEPHVAVLYGRARRIGPLLKGGEITQQTLYNILSLVGADCECGLDPRLLRGIALPVNWNKQTRAFVAAELGFDPDNPMVMDEVSHILKMRANLHPRPTRQGSRAAVDDLPVPFVEDGEPAGSKAAPANPLLKNLAYTLSGIAGLVVLAAVWMVLRARWRDS